MEVEYTDENSSLIRSFNGIHANGFPEYLDRAWIDNDRLMFTHPAPLNQSERAIYFVTRNDLVRLRAYITDQPYLWVESSRCSNRRPLIWKHGQLEAICAWAVDKFEMEELLTLDDVIQWDVKQIKSDTMWFSQTVDSQSLVTYYGPYVSKDNAITDHVYMVGGNIFCKCPNNFRCECETSFVELIDIPNDCRSPFSEHLPDA